ncbi:MAG: helix-turn-helix transcriptional regulator [Thermoleophilia bacterium]
MTDPIDRWLQKCHGYGLRQLRREAGLTQKAVETALSLPPHTVSEWERGTRSPNSKSRRDALAALYGVSYTRIACVNFPGTEIAEMTPSAEVWRVQEVGK